MSNYVPIENGHGDRHFNADGSSRTSAGMAAGAEPALAAGGQNQSESRGADRSSATGLRERLSSIVSAHPRRQTAISSSSAAVFMLRMIPRSTGTAPITVAQCRIERSDVSAR